MTPTPTGSDPTSLQAAQANQLASSEYQIAFLNKDLQTRFEAAWDTYKQGIETHMYLPPERRTPPAVPKAWVLSAPNEYGFQFYGLGTQPVVPAPSALTYVGPDTPDGPSPLTPVLTPNTTDVGPPENVPGWYHVGPQDTRPTGFVVQVPGPNGLLKLQKVGTPWGSYYEVIG